MQPESRAEANYTVSYEVAIWKIALKCAHLVQLEGGCPVAASLLYVLLCLFAIFVAYLHATVHMYQARRSTTGVQFVVHTYEVHT